MTIMRVVDKKCKYTTTNSVTSRPPRKANVSFEVKLFNSHDVICRIIIKQSHVCMSRFFQQSRVKINA